MMLWGRLLCIFVGLLVLTAAEPPLDPIPVCQAASHWKEYDGQAVPLLGRYSFRQAGPKKGRWLDEEACTVKLALDPQTAPKPADQVVIDEVALEAKLSAVKQRTSLGKFRFGSADYDRWAVVFGRFRRLGEQEMQLEYRGDGAVFFVADK